MRGELRKVLCTRWSAALLAALVALNGVLFYRYCTQPQGDEDYTLPQLRAADARSDAELQSDYDAQWARLDAAEPLTDEVYDEIYLAMSLDEAVDLVLFAFEHGENGDLLIQKAPACTIGTQAEAVCELFGGKKEDIRVIGIRHGEKMYETLLTNEECAKAVDMGKFYRVPADNRGLNYDKYFKEGDEKRNVLTEFNSNNTTMLNVEETKAKIASLQYIKDELAKMKAENNEK